MTAEPAKGLHTRPLAGALNDKTCLVWGSRTVTRYWPMWVST